MLVWILLLISPNGEERAVPARLPTVEACVVFGETLFPDRKWRCAQVPGMIGVPA